jgi:hypothetical protein
VFCRVESFSSILVSEKLFFSKILLKLVLDYFRVCWGSCLGDGKWKIQKGKTPEIENGANQTYAGTLSAHFVHTLLFLI